MKNFLPDPSDVSAVVAAVRVKLPPSTRRHLHIADNIGDDQVMAQMRAQINSALAGARAGTTRFHQPPPAEKSGVRHWESVAYRLPVKREYVLGEVIAPNDASFVDTAYRIIMRRPPDDEGFSYFLGELRAGRLSKIEVLGALRWSPEGVASDVHIDGLLIPFKLQQLKRKRWIGPAVSWLHALFRIGTLAERHATQDAVHGHEAHELGRHLNLVIDDVEIQLKNESERVDRITGDIRSELRIVTEAGLDLNVRLAAFEVRHSNQLQLLKEEGALLEARISSAEKAAALVSALSERLTAFEARHVNQLQLLQENNSVLRARLADIEAAAASMSGVLVRISPVVEGILEAQQRDKQRAVDLDPLYADFEDQFRGSSEVIKARLAPYLGWVKNAGAGTMEAPVVDVGSGRGEWLHLLAEHGLQGEGIDLNTQFVATSRAAGLRVAEGDAVALLSARPAASAGAVTSIHLVEHLPFEQVVALIDSAFHALRPGGMIALETPNPENLLVGSHYFYIDPTHRNPVAPSMLQWLVESRGFVDVRIERLSSFRSMNPPPLLSPEIAGASSINDLLWLLHVAPDYAVIGRRP